MNGADPTPFAAVLTADLLADIRRRIRWAAAGRGVQLQDDAVEDLAQDLLLRLWESGSVSTARDLPAYVLTSAINLTRDSLRRRGAAKRSAPGATTGDGAMLSPWAPTPEREAIGREELRHHLAECRRLLSDRQYRIFRLVYLGGYTSREVAERVGLRTSSVDSALHRMRRAVGGRVVPIRQQAARRRLS